MSNVIMVSTGLSRNVHIMARIFSFDNLYLAGKTPLLVREMIVNIRDIPLEPKKSSASWHMGGNSHLTWLSSDSLYLP